MTENARVPFQYKEYELTAVYTDGGNRLEIQDEEGEFVMSFFNYSLWDVEAGLPESTLKLLVAAYKSGHTDGDALGRYKAQREIREALGFKS